VIIGGVILLVALAWWLYVTHNVAVVVLAAPWGNWSIYVLSFLTLTLLALICGHLLRTHWALGLAMGFVYWAAGCMFGALQTGESPIIQPAAALPYIRGMWLLGSTTVMVSSAGILARVIHVEWKRPTIENDTIQAGGRV
jgi:hypothetical protein